MSSSLLLILIVVLWLFVLAPLVVNTRKPIRRTSDALGKTRLLHRGGDELANTRRRPSFTQADVRVSEEIDESLETVDPQLDDEFDVSDVLIDDTGEATTPAVVDGDIVYELEAADSHTPGASSAGTGSVAAGATGDVVGAVVDADGAKAGDAEGETAGADNTASLQAVGGNGAAGNTSASDRADGVVTSVSQDARRDYLDVDAMMFEAYAEASDAEASDAEASGVQTAAGVEVADAKADLEPNPVAEGAAPVDDILTEDDYAFAQKRRGRGGFDPISDAHYAQTRFARRRRSVAGLAAFILVTGIIAALVGGWTWWIPLLGVGLMIVYLVNLRRTVRAEQELRARRIRRMKMARLGVRHREDDALGIPQRLRRPGAVVVELDDEDPDFADLSYTDVSFEVDDYGDLPHARVS